ncbi:MAG: sugar transferase [Kiritimatiellia bacterium]
MADGLCISLVWAAVVYGFWETGAWMRAHGHPGCLWGGYSPGYYLGFWPVPIAFSMLNAALGLYHGNWLYPSAPLAPIEEFRRLVCSALAVHCGTVAVFAFAYGTTDGFSRFVVLASGCLVAVLAQSFRNWMRRILLRLRLGQIPAVLAGGGETALQAAVSIQGDAYSGLRIVGYFEGTGDGDGQPPPSQPNNRRFRELEIPRLGTLRDIVPESRARDIKLLIACQDERFFRTQLPDLASWFTHIDYIPSGKAFPVFGARAVCFDGLGGIEMVNQGRMKMQRLQKRIIDTLLAGMGFALALPFFLLIPVLIKLTSRGPVFYRQQRIGKDGKPFRVWKFRSMFADAEARLERLLARDARMRDEWRRHFKLKRDPRITPLGRLLRKTSLDELPQLFNVLAGNMALIGPRPIVAEEVERYGDGYAVLASVKPGVTGLWQVSGRSDTGYARRVALDTYYILNWSPWMDLWIFLRTIYAVFLMRGAR